MRISCVAALLAASFLAFPAFPGEVSLESAADNTIYQSTIALSNGAGTAMFAGTSGSIVNNVRRCLVRFDVAAAIPAGSTIEAAALNLTTVVGNFSSETCSLHRVLNSWGEGTSFGAMGQGGGADSTTNDASWFHRFYPGTLWTNQGGDFNASPSAAILVAENATYTWSSAQLIADVQGFLDQPDSNFGWMVRGNESVNHTAKRFATREDAEPSIRPTLVITFRLPCPGDLNNDGLVDDADFVIFANAYDLLDCLDPTMPSGCPADLNLDGLVDDSDFVLFVVAYNELLCP